MRRDLIASLTAIVLFTVVCGLAYPLAVTGVAQLVMPGRANGSLVAHGSTLVGQDFAGKPQYFQSRPSATEYSADATFFNNLGPNQQDLADQLAEHAKTYRALNGAAAPPDAATTSASGIDPHISPENAAIQARRVARVRGLPLDRVTALIEAHTDGRVLGFMGEPGVNVLELNLALDEETR